MNVHTQGAVQKLCKAIFDIVGPLPSLMSLCPWPKAVFPKLFCYEDRFELITSLLDPLEFKTKVDARQLKGFYVFSQIKKKSSY